MIIDGPQAAEPFKGRIKGYNPATDTWRKISSVNATVGRCRHTAVCTGSEVIFWGGQNSPGISAKPVPSGGIYNPTTDTWRPISTNNVLARSQHAAVWTGTEMIVWGGIGCLADGYDTGTLNSGGRYDLATDTWHPMEFSGAPVARTGHSMVWTGSELLIFGGRTNAVESTGRTSVSNGPRYQPQTDSWAGMASSQAPSRRQSHVAVWTGAEMIVWGGPGSVVGARYNPITDEWASMTTLGAPKLSVTPPGVWTGSSLLLFSGTRETTTMSSATFQYTLTKPVYLYQHP